MGIWISSRFLLFVCADPMAVHALILVVSCCCCAMCEFAIVEASANAFFSFSPQDVMWIYSNERMKARIKALSEQNYGFVQVATKFYTQFNNANRKRAKAPFIPSICFTLISSRNCPSENPWRKSTSSRNGYNFEWWCNLRLAMIWVASLKKAICLMRA